MLFTNFWFLSLIFSNSVFFSKACKKITSCTSKKSFPKRALKESEEIIGRSYVRAVGVLFFSSMPCLLLNNLVFHLKSFPFVYKRKMTRGTKRLIMESNIQAYLHFPQEQQTCSSLSLKETFVDISQVCVTYARTCLNEDHTHFYSLLNHWKKWNMGILLNLSLTCRPWRTRMQKQSPMMTDEKYFFGTNDVCLSRKIRE